MDPIEFNAVGIKKMFGDLILYADRRRIRYREHAEQHKRRGYQLEAAREEGKAEQCDLEIVGYREAIRCCEEEIQLWDNHVAELERESEERTRSWDEARIDE